MTGAIPLPQRWSIINKEGSSAVESQCGCAGRDENKGGKHGTSPTEGGHWGWKQSEEQT